MIIGIPKEIKNNENRVGITPAGVTLFKINGHEIWVEAGAGLGSGFSDEDYLKARSLAGTHSRGSMVCRSSD